MATKLSQGTSSTISLRAREKILRMRGAEQSNGLPDQSPRWRASIRSDDSSTAKPSSSVSPTVLGREGNEPSAIQDPAPVSTGPAQDSMTVPPAPIGPKSMTGINHRRDDHYPPASYASIRRQGSSRYNHRSPSVLNPPSAAAVNRAASYTPYRRSCHSRSHIPDPIDDWLRIRNKANETHRLRKDEYQIGLIIRAPLHEQDGRGDARALGCSSSSSIASNTSEITLAERFTTPSRFGPIFTKCRKMIVVACHQENYVAIPLFTHNGKGLDCKACPDEYVSVKDHRDEDAEGTWRPLSKWNPLVTEYVKDGIDIFERKSTAHLAYPVSRNYRLPVIMEGRLKGSSAKAVKDLYERFAGVD